MIYNLIQEADVVVIGAGAGLSAAAGITYSGKRFTDNFQDFIDGYGLTDMYSSVFHKFNSLEERWAYLSRHIQLNRYNDEPYDLYKKLYDIVKNKKHFVITTNGDGQFYNSGFDTKDIFAVQGDYKYFQCANACHNTLYDNKTAVTKMINEQKSCKIPTNLIPICPKCGGEMFINIRIDGSFIEDKNWDLAKTRYSEFLNNNKDKKVVLLELGIGFNTPGIIRYPFEQMAANNINFKLVRINRDNIKSTYNVPDDSVMIQGDINEILNQII